MPDSDQEDPTDNGELVSTDLDWRGRTKLTPSWSAWEWG